MPADTMKVRIEGFDWVNSDRTLFVASTGRKISCPDSERGAEDLLGQLLGRYDILVFETVQEDLLFDSRSGEYYEYLIRDLLDRLDFMRRPAYRRKRVLVASDRFPSTQRCFPCRRLGRVSRQVRSWQCRHCGQKLDRDRNAARNLRAVGQEFQRGITENVRASFPAWQPLR